MRSFPRLALAAFGLLVRLPTTVCAQQPAAVPVPSVQPLQRMPYSPSLDLQSMDRNIDPCVDFYKFSCGGWIAHNPIPADQAAWSVYAKLENDNQQFLWGILEADAKATQRTPVQQKVGDYFESCMNTGAIDDARLGDIDTALRIVDTSTSRRGVVSSIAFLSHDYPVNAFFRAGIGQDAVDSSKEIVEVRAGGLGLPDRDYYTKSDPRTVKLREQYQSYVQQLLVLRGEPEAQAKTEAQAVLRIETALAQPQLTRVERRDPHKTYHMMKITDLQQLTPSVEWPVYFEMLSASPPRPATPGEPVVLTKMTGANLTFSSLNVAEPEFMKVAQTELVNESIDALKAYLAFTF